MIDERQNDDALYAALIARDPAFEGLVFVCVHTTGVFCRLTCAARKPLRRNVSFCPSIETAVAGGFRACKRCKPTVSLGEPEPVVTSLLAAIETEPNRRWRESDLAERGVDPSTARRAFKRQFGRTFLQVARAQRLVVAANALSRGATVISAQIDAGYESGSGFRTAIANTYGSAPQSIRGSRQRHPKIEIGDPDDIPS
jgi:AraC family transcriptional regulator, regulatory protein of adaptative response / methylated-DNA-[protein]-cysteine methyltransferase